MELNAHNISFRYRQDSCWILENINFSISSGERIGLFAPSGYGKSTFSQILSGSLSPSRGCVTLDGSPLPQKGVCPVQLIYQHPEKAINPRWKMSRVLQECGGIPQEMLDRFGIELPWLDRYPGQLSGGELQRFNIARALAVKPDFLICDEISTMLDTITQAQIWNALLESAEHAGILVVTHNMALAKRICTRIFDLSEGTYEQEVLQ